MHVHYPVHPVHRVRSGRCTSPSSMAYLTTLFLFPTATTTPLLTIPSQPIVLEVCVAIGSARAPLVLVMSTTTTVLEVKYQLQQQTGVCGIAQQQQYMPTYHTICLQCTPRLL